MPPRAPQAMDSGLFDDPNKGVRRLQVGRRLALADADLAPPEGPPSTLSGVVVRLPRPCSPAWNRTERGGTPRNELLSRLRADTGQGRDPQRVSAHPQSAFDSRRLHLCLIAALKPARRSSARPVLRFAPYR